MRRFSNSPPDWVFPDRVAVDEAVDAEPISSESVVISDSPLESAGPRVALRCLADVVTKPLEWVLEDLIPRGEVTLLAGDVASNIVRADAAENEISWGTLRRAFSSLGCKTSREKGKERHGRWFWRLPGEGFFYRAGAPRLVAQSAHAARDMQLIETPEK